MPEKSPGLAAFLSFLIAGLGQFYAGAAGKGLAFIALLFVIFLVGLAAPFLWLLSIPVWVLGMLDAYASTVEWNRLAAAEFRMAVQREVDAFRPPYVDSDAARAERLAAYDRLVRDDVPLLRRDSEK